MRKRAVAVPHFYLLAALVAAVPAHAQNYSYQTDDRLRSTAAYPQEVHSNGTVVYSSDQYPTAQGRYLSLPPGYQQSNREAVSTTPQYIPPQYPALQQPRSVAPAPTPPVYQAQSDVNAQRGASPIPSSTSYATSLDRLPSYTYDRNLDPRYVPKPPRRELPDSEDHIGLGTHPGGEFALQVSSYRYQEHVVPDVEFVHETGWKIGAVIGGNKVYSNNWFIGGDFRFAIGKNDYTGSGTESGLLDILADARFLGGKDFIWNGAFWNSVNFDLTPYIGLGFRYLYNDARGTSSTGASGYQRYSHYFYLPVGLTPRFRVTSNTRLSLNLEYDQLLYGWQVSSLGDAQPGDTDLTNTQSNGFGLRGSLMYEWPSWGFGPYFNYWNINQSTTDCSALSCGDEPHNQTIEYGIEGRYKF